MQRVVRLVAIGLVTGWLRRRGTAWAPAGRLAKQARAACWRGSSLPIQCYFVVGFSMAMAATWRVNALYFG